MKLKQEIKPKLTNIYENVLKFLSDFNADFLIGLLVGVLCVSMILYRFQGIPKGILYCFDLALSPYGQFHLVSVDLFFALIPLSYYFLRFEKNNGKRVLASCLFPILVFSLHDITWLIETHFVPQVYANNIMLTCSLEEYSYHYSKNLINIIPCLAIFLKYRYFKINKKFLIAFSILVGFHLIDIIFKINIYILNGSALLLMETVDSLPYLFLIKDNSGKP